MVKITVTWQRDDQHKLSYKEEIELPDSKSLKEDSITETSTSITQSEEINSYQLHRLTRAVVALTLENCIDQLFITKALLNEITTGSCLELFRYKTLWERVAPSAKSKKRFQEEEYEKIPFTDHQKMRNDLCFLCSTLMKVAREVTEKGDYSTLVKVVSCMEQEEEDANNLQEVVQKKLDELEDLKQLLRYEKQDFEEQLHEDSTVSENWKNKVEDVLAYGRAEVTYVNAWEATRKYQNHLILTEKEDVFRNIIASNKTKIDNENRIHTEIENFIAENTEDLLNGIEYWMHHYEAEVERLDSEIYKLKSRWEILTTDHIALAHTYTEHKQAVEDWKAIKEERRKQEELRQLQIYAAIRIQAWWRGVMVRKKLGPFRKKKGKGKDKKGKDKGKGKKKK